MITIPPLARIEGDQKEIRAFQPVQSGLHLFVREIASHDLGTQFCAELIENRRLFEKLLYLMRLLSENFPDQVTVNRTSSVVVEMFHE